MLERIADGQPDGTLPEAERAKRAAHAKKAYYQRLSLKASIAKRKAKGGAA